jgi:two-component system OmpR family response regulator
MQDPSWFGERVVSVFGWIAKYREPPPQWDLRRIGWTLSDEGAAATVWLIDGRSRRHATPAGSPASCLFVGIDSGRERARLLEAGCGDAVPANVGLPELARRARRVAERGDTLPRCRELGRLSLDLLYRDAHAGERWLALHPREFALLWRLAERPGISVPRTTLLRDVWRLEFEPGTNSVEVHISRLRAKLAAAGLAGLVETDPSGGYRVTSRDRFEPLSQLPSSPPPCASAISC